jgi:hypothetical protein
MIAVILQPGYLPWLGFFEQMWRSDIFVIYDNVQFDKNGWRNRNRIKTVQGIKWLTVPVHVTLGDRIKDIRIDNTINWQKKHLKSLELAYAKAPFFKNYFQSIEGVLKRNWEYLLDLDAALIGEISKLLGLKRKLLFSSKLGIDENGKIGRLINICKALGADTFYEGAAGKNYIEDSEFKKAGIKIEYQDYKHPVYSQLHGDFVSHLSVIDLIFNEGPRSLEILTHQYGKQ